jgi:hypothetical protein
VYVGIWASPGCSDGLSAVFLTPFSSPAAAPGCTFTEVESSDTAVTGYASVVRRRTPVFGPPVEAHRDRMPGAERFGEGTPGTGVFGQVDDGVKTSGVVNGYVSPPAGKKRSIFFCCCAVSFMVSVYHCSLVKLKNPPPLAVVMY